MDNVFGIKKDMLKSKGISNKYFLLVSQAENI